MPNPKAGESHKDYIDRCIPMVVKDGTAKDGAQARAVCESLWERRHSTLERSVSASAVTADVRQGQLYGHDRIIVPMILAVGGLAIRAMGSAGSYELIPVEELEKSAAAWNGRPVTFSHHVTDDGKPVSANAPDVLDRCQIGSIFGARVEDGKLKGEAWIDPERVAAIGGEAQAVIDRVLAREMIEVSVGCRVRSSEVVGRDINGNAYTRAWTNIAPDHLAFLALSEIGACSNEAGCGAPRAAKDQKKEIDTMSMFQRILSHLRFGNEESGPSDNDTRKKVFEALHASEPAFDGIVAIYPESSTVIYSVAPNGEYMLKRRAYALGEGGAVALADDMEIVESKVEFVPVKSSETEESKESQESKEASTDTPETVKVEPTTAATVDTPTPKQSSAGASCPCGGRRNAADNEVKGVRNMAATNKELAERLIACKGSPFTEEDRANLESFSNARLLSLADQLDPEKPETRDATEAKPLTIEEFMKVAPPEVVEMVSRYQTEEKARHATLVSQLKDAQAVYDETRLAAMSVTQLEEVANLVGIASPDAAVSYLGRSIPDETRGAATKATPRPYDIALQRRRGATAPTEQDKTN